MTEEELENELEKLDNSYSEKFSQTKRELEDILETVEKNRKIKEGEIVKTHGLDSLETNKNIEKLDRLDEVTVKKFTKNLPSLDEKPKKSFFKRLFSKSGLAILATALVGAAAIATGVLALPAIGILAAVGFSAALAAPSIYSSVSSFIAVCNPKTRDTLENIDDIRQATKGAPTELAGLKRQSDKDRHAEILKTIDKTNNVSSSGQSAKTDASGGTTDDFLSVWKENHPEHKSKIQNKIIDIKHDKVELIDSSIFGLDKMKKKALEQLSCSPDAVSKFANHTIERQKKIDEKELSVLTRKLEGLVAVGEKTETEKDEIIARCKKKQQDNMDALCGNLSSILDTVKRNRNIVQAQDLSKSEAFGSKHTFEELLSVREKSDKDLIEKYTKDLPDLDPDKKKSSFVKRLFSWSGAKLVASAALAGLAIAAAVLVPPLGIAATLGLSIAAAGSTYSAVSSFVALCNPKSKDTLQHIEDVRNGINGRSAELSRLKRETEKARHEEIITTLKSSPNDSVLIQKEAENILDRLTTRLEAAKKSKNENAVEELSVLQKSVKTVIDAEK